MLCIRDRSCRNTGNGNRRIRTPNERNTRGTMKTIDKNMNNTQTIASVKRGLFKRNDRIAEMTFANVTNRILTIAETLAAADRLTPQAKGAFCWTTVGADEGSGG